jgi:hypothetical protein
MLPETEHVLGQQEILARMAESERSQIGDIRRLFERFEAPIPEGHGQVIPALLEEMREELCRQSGMYPPAASDFRLLAGFGRLVHHKLAALRSGIIAARLMEAHEVEEELNRCLREEVGNSKCLVELASGALRLCSASTREEMAGAG